MKNFPELDKLSKSTGSDKYRPKNGEIARIRKREIRRVSDRASVLSEKSILRTESTVEDPGSNLVAEAMQHTKSDPKTCFYETWGMLMLIPMVYIAMLTPFQIAFMPPLLLTIHKEYHDEGVCNIRNRLDCCNPEEKGACDGVADTPCYLVFRSLASVVFTINVLVDIVYWLDMYFKLSEPYFDEAAGYVIHQRKKIRKHYMTFKNCGIDLIAIAPVQIAVDVIIWVNYLETEETTLSPVTITVLRLFAMLKMLRVQRHYEQFKWLLSDFLKFPQFVQATIKMFVSVVFVSNLLACLLNIVSVLGNPEGRGDMGWFSSKDYLVQVGSAQDCENKDRYTDTMFLWLWSMYWAMMTMTTIGYGDVIPQRNAVELIFVIFAMMVGVILYTINTGKFLNALIHQERAHTQLSEKLDGISKFLKKHKVPFSMYRTLRSFFRNTFDLNEYTQGLQAVKYLSPGLRDSLARKAFTSKFERVDWIAPLLHITSANQHFMGSLLFHMRAVAFPPLEQVIQEGEHLGDDKKMFIVNSGLVWSRNSFVRAGGHFGEDMICRKAVRYYGASCLTYAQCITLSRRDLFTVLNSCPTFRRHINHIRYCAVLMAFRQMARQLGHRVSVVRRIARHIADDTGYTTGVRLDRTWHENSIAGNSLVLFEASKIVTRAAINEQERMQYGEIVLIVDSRSQQLGQLRCVRRKRGAGPRSNAAPKSRFSNVRRSTRPSKDNKVQPLMSAGPKSKTPSDRKIKKINALARHLSSASRKSLTVDMIEVSEMQEDPEDNNMPQEHREHEANEPQAEKPRYQDCMTQIQESILQHHQYSSVAGMAAPELVLYIASALRDRNALSEDDMKFVQSGIPNQHDLMERIEHIRKHNLEMTLSTASDFLQKTLLERRH